MSHCIWHNANIEQPESEGVYLTWNSEGYHKVCIYSLDMYLMDKESFDYLKDKEDRSGFCEWNDECDHYFWRDVDFWTDLPYPPDCGYCKNAEGCEDYELGIEQGEQQ